jgi:hypothetical protein
MQNTQSYARSKFPTEGRYGLWSSRLWRHVILRLVKKVSEKCIDSFFGVHENWGDTLLRNAGNRPQDDTNQALRRRDGYYFSVLMEVHLTRVWSNWRSFAEISR